MIVADTSGLIAFFNAAEPSHEQVRRIVEAQGDPLVVSPFVVAELDYLIAQRAGVEAEIAVLSELATGAYLLADFDEIDLARAADVVSQYRDQQVGVADASIVVLADRYRTRTLLTLDHRHFGVLRPLSGGRFRIVP
jgi:predicted nucleic acid-binding protein